MEDTNSVYSLSATISPSILDSVGNSEMEMSNDGRMIVIGQKDFDAGGGNDHGRVIVYVPSEDAP